MHVSCTSQWLPEREDHVIGAEGGVYKALHPPNEVTISNDQALGKYMVTIWNRAIMCLSLW